MAEAIMNIEQKQSHKNNTTPYYGVDGPIGPTGPVGDVGTSSSQTLTTGSITQSITLNNASSVSLLLWTLPVQPNDKTIAKITTTIRILSGANFQTSGYGVYYGQLEIWDSLGALRSASKPFDMAMLNSYLTTRGQYTTMAVQIEEPKSNFLLGYTYQIFFRIYTSGSVNRDAYVPFISYVSVLLT